MAASENAPARYRGCQGGRPAIAGQAGPGIEETIGGDG